MNDYLDDPCRDLEHTDIMKNRVSILRITFCAAAVLSVCACQTVSLPKIDMIKSPEFAEEAANFGTEFPRTEDAPFEPEDIRSDSQWDSDARVMQALRDKSIKTDVEPGLSEAEAEARFEALKAKVQAYKKDDPASGPVQGFPKYKPRR